MNILDLPPELLTVCFTYLKGTDLAKVAQTCTIFKEISSIERLWQERCLKEYYLPIDSKLKCSFKELFGKVLYKYGFLVGLWRNSTTCYGGFVHIWYNQEADIIAEELNSKKDVHESLLQKQIFRVLLAETGDVKKEWLADCIDPKPSCEIYLDKDIKNRNKFCVFPEKRNKSAEEKEKEKLAFLEECELRGTHRELCMYKWQSYKENKNKQSFERIDTSKFEPVAKVPIQPGLFKGMYGGHGTEIIHLFYESDGTCAQGQKISGDPNVPSGEISLRFNLDNHMVLDKDQFHALRREQLDDDVKSAFNHEKMLQQPFVIPNDILIDNRNSVCPKFCIARFLGKGTVSPMGYRHPSLINIHFVVFDENSFGVLWIDLHSFSMFSRIKETFPALR